MNIRPDKSGSLENSRKKWCAYRGNNGYSNEDYYQQHSGIKYGNFSINRKIWCHYHNSTSHSNDECYHQRGSKFENSSSVDGKISGKQKTFIANSDPTGCDAKFCCNCKREDSSKENNDESCSPSPGIGFTFVACRLPLLLKQADGFQPLMHSGSFKHFIDPELIRGVESMVLKYTKKEPPMEITSQSILVIVVRGTDDVLRKVKLPIVLVPGFKRNLFSRLAAAQKGAKTIIEKNESSLDLGLFRIQLT